MRHVEAVIRLFDPEYNVMAISVWRRNKRNRWFKFRAVLDALKAAEGPLTVREIVPRVLADKGEASPDLKTIRDLKAGYGPPLPGRPARPSRTLGRGCRRGGRLGRNVPLPIPAEIDRGATLHGEADNGMGLIAV
jgi:hypothetical protein